MKQQLEAAEEVACEKEAWDGGRPSLPEIPFGWRGPRFQAPFVVRPGAHSSDARGLGGPFWGRVWSGVVVGRWWKKRSTRTVDDAGVRKATSNGVGRGKCLPDPSTKFYRIHGQSLGELNVGPRNWK